MGRAEERTIRKIVFTGLRRASVGTEPARAIGPREARIRTVLSGISRATEMNIDRGDAAFFERSFDPRLGLFLDQQEGTWSYPIEFGYENVGRIEEVGADVTQSAISDTVVTYQPHQDERIVDLDSRDILMGDMVPALPLPEGLTPEHGVFVPLLGVAPNALLDAQMLLTQTLAVLGAGVVGLLATQIYRLSGAGQICVVEPMETQRRVARGLGADDVLQVVLNCEDH